MVGLSVEGYKGLEQMHDFLQSNKGGRVDRTLLGFSYYIPIKKHLLI